MIDIYEALDDLHVEITCSEDGLDWFWRNTDTGQESDWTHETAREALLHAADDFNIDYDRDDLDVSEEYDRDDTFHDHLERSCDEAYYPEPDDSMDGDHDSAMASAGWGTGEDYGEFDDRI